jgi:prepilin-type processing-associated H-X9-DG protein
VRRRHGFTLIKLVCDHYLTTNSSTFDRPRGPLHGCRMAQSRHPGGVNTLFADGGVLLVKNNVNVVPWRALGIRARGEVVSSDS